MQHKIRAEQESEQTMAWFGECAQCGGRLAGNAHDLGVDGLKQLLTDLPEREAQVVVLRFGLLGYYPLTLNEVGAIVAPELNRERIRQIEDRALRHLRALVSRAARPLERDKTAPEV